MPGEASSERLSSYSSRAPQVLYVLGDLFDAWVGDDDAGPAGEALYRDVAASFAQAAAQGWQVKLMIGNRDFLLGERFAAQSCATLIADSTVVTLADGVPTVLMHGDTLCTDDQAYLRWRETCRSPAWQQPFLAQPLAARRAEVKRLRAVSKQAMQGKPAQVMDVNQSAVESALRAAGVTRLIHGHTHRRATHRFAVDGAAAERWVLPDWYGSGGFLNAAPNGLQFLAVSD